MSLLQMQHDMKPEQDRKPNQTGIPSYMKQDFEARSGLNYDDVRIHYSSPKPAELGALAYTQSPHVYIGPGQERHLPHELVHVAQQKRGAVRPTGRLGNVSVNDDPDLERQADEGIVVQRAQAPSGPSSQIVQRKIGMEYQTVGRGDNVFIYNRTTRTRKTNSDHGVLLFERDNIKVTADGPDLEYVTPPADTPDQAKKYGDAAAKIHKTLQKGSFKPEIKGLRVYEDYCVYTIVKTNKKAKVETTTYELRNLKEATAHPQATVGLRMDKIADLLTDLGGTPDEETVKRIKAPQEEEIEPESMDASGIITLGLTSSGLKPPKGAVERKKKIMDILKEQKQTMLSAIDEAENAVGKYLDKESAGYKSIVGLLSLLIAYNEQFLVLIKNQGSTANAKNAMPVMSRTSLFDAYHTLGDDERAIFLKSINQVPWKTWIDPADPSHPKTVLAGEYDEKNSKWNIVSLEDWIGGLGEKVGEDGKVKKVEKAAEDVMYDRFHSIGSLAEPREKDLNAEKKGRMLNKFNIRRPTDIGLGDNVPGMLVELRGLERGVSPERWGEVAWRVAYLSDCLNKGVAPDVSKVPDFSKVSGPQKVPAPSKAQRKHK